MVQIKTSEEFKKQLKCMNYQVIDNLYSGGRIATFIFQVMESMIQIR